MKDNLYNRVWQYEQSQNIFNGSLDYFVDIENLTFKEFCNIVNRDFSNNFYNDYQYYGLDKFDELKNPIKQKMLSAIYFYHFMLSEYKKFQQKLEFKNRKQRASRINSKKIKKLKDIIPILKEISEVRFKIVIEEIGIAINEFEQPQLLEVRKKHIKEYCDNVINNYDFLKSELNTAQNYQPNGLGEFSRKENMIKNIKEAMKKIEDNDVQLIAMEQKKLYNNLIEKPQKPSKRDLSTYLLSIIIDDTHKLKDTIKTLVSKLEK